MDRIDRIDSMDHKEKDAAIRELIRAVTIYHPNDSPCGRDIWRALAAFDPTPLDRAKAALEKAGFVREAFSTRHRGCVCIHEFNDPNIVLWYAIPKESP